MHAAFHVRPATLQDANAIAELGPRTFQEAFGTLLPAEVIAGRMAVAYASAQVRKDLADPRQAWLVAEVAGGLVGFLSLRESTPPHCVATPVPCELQRLYVAKEWHGRGPGLALLNAGLQEALARKAESLWLLAWDANSRALAFYKNQGFQVVGTQPVLLAEIELPHLVMARGL